MCERYFKNRTVALRLVKRCGTRSHVSERLIEVHFCTAPAAALEAAKSDDTRIALLKCRLKASHQ
jgi:hypothetical protein